MTYNATVLAHSIAFGVPLVTMEVTFPRFILAEFNTHRMLSRNSASSRAIPVERRIEQVRKNPFVPEAFTLNKRGMQADTVLDEAAASEARWHWLKAANAAADQAELLAGLGVHKQHANRLLEPFVWHTAVVTATEWENFFALRCHPAAQPEMQITAKLMREAMAASKPCELREGEWHLPYVTAMERGAHYDTAVQRDLLCRALSVVRCAAVSYERQAAERTFEQMFARHDEMAEMRHWSPFEHQAKVATREEIARHATFQMMTGIGRDDGPRSFEERFIGNFRAPWLQHRKLFSGEAVFSPKETT